jgi:hypothetical protein
MPRGDRWYLAALVLVGVVAFLPWSRATQVGVLPLFAWLMAGLMVVGAARSARAAAVGAALANGR